MPAFSGLMPHRPMRRAAREVTDTAELVSIVRRAQVLRVGASDAEGPFVVPMSFGFEVVGEGEAARWTFWLHSADEGRKVEAWSASSEVALELDVPVGVIEGDFACACSYAYESVMACGRIARVTERAEKLRGLARLMEHMAPEAPAEFAEQAVERVAVWRVDVDHLTGKRREGSPFSPPSEAGDAPAPEQPHKKRKGRKAEKTEGQGRGSRDGAHGRGEKDGRSSKKPSKKELRRQVERALAGERCPGCGHHCKLADPDCGKGRKLRERRLKKLGLDAVAV